MTRQTTQTVALLLMGLVAITGCHPTQPFYFHEDGDLSHYIERATEISHPDVDNMSLAEATETMAPLTVINPEFEEFWDLSLEECVHLAMQNSKVVRNIAHVTSSQLGGGALGAIPGAPTIYDPAVTETSTGGGSRSRSRSGQFGPAEVDIAPEGAVRAGAQGVEDALAEFDAQFAAIANAQTQERPRNGANPFVGDRSINRSFQASISKLLATGGAVYLRHQTDYDWNNLNPNTQGRAVPSHWDTSFEVEFRHPLLRGRGTQINRIGIILARINGDISLADFELSIRNLVSDVENAYWDLHCAYRTLETAKIARDSAHRTWKVSYDKFLGGKEVSYDEANAREQYFFFRSRAHQALRDLHDRENNLRWLLGLAATDKRFIRPMDEPTLARVAFEWQSLVTETLFKSPELRQQKWRIKQRELELISAKNQLLPSLNIALLHRWVGRGDELIGEDRLGLNFPNQDNIGNALGGSRAFDVLTEGDFQESFVGLEFLPPSFGARRELAGVRNAQLQMAREKARLDEMELQQTHLLTDAIQDLEVTYSLVQDQFNRIISLKRQVEDLDLIWSVGQGTDNRGRDILNLLLNAQRSLADARSEYYRNICEYNKFIKHVHFLKGSLLEYNSIALSEGPWPHKAYWDAMEKARERDASYYLDYGWTRPNVVSRGPVQYETTGVPHEVIESEYHEGAEVIESGEMAPIESSEPPVPEALDAPGPITSVEGASELNSAATESPAPVDGFAWGSLGLQKRPAAKVAQATADDASASTTTAVAPASLVVPNSLRAESGRPGLGELPAVRQVSHEE